MGGHPESPRLAAEADRNQVQELVDQEQKQNEKNPLQMSATEEGLTLVMPQFYISGNGIPCWSV